MAVSVLLRNPAGLHQVGQAGRQDAGIERTDPAGYAVQVAGRGVLLAGVDPGVAGRVMVVNR